MKTGTVALSITLLFLTNQITVAQGLWRCIRISLNTGLTENAEAYVIISPKVVTDSAWRRCVRIVVHLRPY
ncbi:hypothetical protein JXQ31_01835 [candidate division KSB1 bacterium]|nr:hypothetical protein [candidate division KSB1 bacterium]